MKIVGWLLVALGVIFFLAMQMVRPSIPSKPATAEIQAPAEVKQVLNKSCYSCHSDQRRLSWFDEIAPAYWLVRSDVLTAREHLNFEEIGAKPAAAQRATLFEAVNMIQLGAMPLPKFVRLHPEAKVSPEELATLKAYLAPWSVTPPAMGVMAAAGTPRALGGVVKEWNGMAFPTDFESWRPISFTDRGDNNTFRFILGNDVAYQAAQAGRITPWPDGAEFAKIAWPQVTGADGLVHPGSFIQVEFMRKDAKGHRDTEGWEWGRWRGLDLKPYGTDGQFVTECTSCHLPVHGNDYVYTLPVTPATVKGGEIVNNAAAALPGTLPFQPLGWNAITMFVDPKTHTMATLYGNPQAMEAVRGRGATLPVAYGAGSVLALVTWVQRDDPHWFGARIPAGPQSVEFVEVAPVGQITGYQRYAGDGLTQESVGADVTGPRRDFILGLSPAQLP